MRNETVGVLDLRRNLSALLETTQRRPLMVHRYGSPWVCVVSDAYWQRHAALLAFDPLSHPLAMLLRLQRHWLPLQESGMADGLGPAQVARALLLQAMHALGGMHALHDQVRHHRLWHWFVAGGHDVIEAWRLPALRAGLQALLDDTGARDALLMFAQRDDVAVLARRCGGLPPHIDADACRRMTMA
ncbi:hypothetical protein [Stenotrophomonas sp. 24(2023)]|uniref:hypothetical protein n=1 Tax=Stenotrophomonas sp. 24(2023) TaxID=3068324 RepID=UPI0027DEB736|nr:hypothetical protein [Stenotrophomonas sp. 24(2023)]WMJ69406.1 hypothetical protein Q9R17_19880 [Stenotrophomonas sp. 24(2023)]